MWPAVAWIHTVFDVLQQGVRLATNASIYPKTPVTLKCCSPGAGGSISTENLRGWFHLDGVERRGRHVVMGKAGCEGRSQGGEKRPRRTHFQCACGSICVRGKTGCRVVLGSARFKGSSAVKAEGYSMGAGGSISTENLRGWFHLREASRIEVGAEWDTSYERKKERKKELRPWACVKEGNGPQVNLPPHPTDTSYAFGCRWFHHLGGRCWGRKLSNTPPHSSHTHPVHTCSSRSAARCAGVPPGWCPAGCSTA